ncbi:MAG: protein-tyrosine phosphatase family protein [Acidimicrobiales bacterium]
MSLKAALAAVDAFAMTAVVMPGAVPVEGRAPASSRSVARATILRLAALVVGMFLVPNLAIIGLHLLAQRQAPAPSMSLPIKNFAEVDERLWRGAAPTRAGYEALAAHGVTTVIDLRAEDDLHVDEAWLQSLGITRIHLPLRDGQAPGADLVSTFLADVGRSKGRAFVHCGAGVGRTGTMSAAYLVATGQATPKQALRRNLSVGPPSLEQISFSAGLTPTSMTKPAPLMVAISRTLDAPRRVWTTLRD